MSTDAEKANSMAGMKIDHVGEELSFSMEVADDGQSFIVDFGDGKPLVTVEVESGVDLICPSVEGTTIRCFAPDSSQCFFDAVTGKQLTTEELRERNPHFYS